MLRFSRLQKGRAAPVRGLSSFLDDSCKAVLSREQIESYENNGYFVIRSLLSADDVKKYYLI